MKHKAPSEPLPLTQAQYRARKRAAHKLLRKTERSLNELREKLKAHGYSGGEEVTERLASLIAAVKEDADTIARFY